MAKIPWWIWIGVGAVMYYISQRVGGKMSLFMYAGLFFIVVGIFKLLVAFIIGGRAKTAVKESHEIRSQQYTCPRCRFAIATTHRFCPHCGTRLR